MAPDEGMLMLHLISQCMELGESILSLRLNESIFDKYSFGRACDGHRYSPLHLKIAAHRDILHKITHAFIHRHRIDEIIQRKD